VQVNYQVTHLVTVGVHLEVQVLLGAWALASFLCQQWLKREGGAERARLAWVGADVTLLTALLALTGSQVGPLLVGYPFLIAASGLWFQVPLVWFTTICCEAAYALLLLIPPEFSVTPMAHYHLIVVTALAVEGFVVAYQVQRIRVLNRYYESRPLP